jgi:large subunit ribosomal protein L28
MRLSHSHRRTKRRWNPNIQRIRATVNGTNRRIDVCTSCIRAGKVTKPRRRVVAPCCQPHTGSSAPSNSLSSLRPVHTPTRSGARNPASAKARVISSGEPVAISSS